jgi:NADPH-dependent 2,4-dienoyl-CoA reductase/sulfur reductase-like enzyme
MTHVLIIGGSDAASSAALRARGVAPSAEVTVLVADEVPNYSICGLPFFLSGEVSDWHALAHHTTAELEAAGMCLLLRHTAQAIEPTLKQVAVLTPERRLQAFTYDQPIVAGLGIGPGRRRTAQGSGE